MSATDPPPRARGVAPKMPATDLSIHTILDDSSCGLTKEPETDEASYCGRKCASKSEAEGQEIADVI